MAEMDVWRDRKGGNTLDRGNKRTENGYKY